MFLYSTWQITVDFVKTELKEEADGAGLVSFVTAIPLCASNTAMRYDPFLVPLDLEDDDEEEEEMKKLSLNGTGWLVP